MTLEMIGTQSIHPDYSNLHNIIILMYLVSESFVPSWDEFVLMLKATESEEIENYYYLFSKS